MTLPLVGRDGDLAALAEAWARVVAGTDRCRVVLVTGEPGTGKSRLVAEALERLAPSPHRVLAGQARTHAPAPYDWLASALSGHDLSGVPVPADAMAWLTQGPALPERRFAPRTLLRAAVDVVRAMLDGGPGVLVVEDLHDLDPASLDLVSELSAAHQLPALLLVTSRAPGEARLAPLAARVLARVGGSPQSARRHLGRLSVAQVAAALADVPDVADPVSAYRSTGGNPYRLAEFVATAAVDTADIAPSVGTASSVGTVPPVGTVQAGGVAAVGAVGGADTAVGGTGTVPHEVRLTAREREVLACLAAGMTNRQAARQLDISVRTVTVHVSNLLRKTGAASRTEAALWALRHHLPSATP